MLALHRIIASKIFKNHAGGDIFTLVVGENIGKYYAAVKSISAFPFRLTLVGVTNLG